MNLYDHYQTTDKEWIEWGTTGASFLLARANGHDNVKFKAAMERKLRKYRTEIRLEVLSDDLQTAATLEVYAETVVLDWKGVSGPDTTDKAGKRVPGPPLAFSREACIKLFSDLPELFDEIQRVAMDRKTFQDGAAELDAKN